MDLLLTDLYAAFGWKSRIAAPLLGRYLGISIKKEEKRLAAGWTYEPDTFYEKNAAALSLSDAKAGAVAPRAVSAQMGCLQSNGGVTPHRTIRAPDPPHCPAFPSGVTVKD